MKKILVTGGAGFLGSHLCDALVSKGNQVICFDTLATGSIENISHLINRQGFSFVETLSWNIPYFDQVYHLASPTAPAMIQKFPEMTYQVNDMGTRKLLSVINNPRKLLFTSTVKVHGDCERVAPYILGKRAGEKIVVANGGKVARLANTYGPRMALDDSRVIPVFISRALQGETLSLWNGGRQVDSFCYVSDVIDGLISFMDSPEKGVIEFGAERGTTIIDLARLILELTHSDSTLFTGENITVVDECHKVANLTRAKTLLDWKPQVPLQNGLLRTIEYVRSRLLKEAA
jgi:UDP-glucuronate decarboxylase